jgi:topoisomerase-4 subunit A
VGKTKDTGQVWAKRLIVDKFILDKIYRFLDESLELEHISMNPDVVIELQFSSPKIKKMTVALRDIPIKGAQTRGVRLSPQKVKKIILR